MNLLFTRLAAVVACVVAALAGPAPGARAQAPTATWQWAARGTSAGYSAAWSMAYSVQADAAGNTYVAGQFSDELTLGPTTLTSTSAHNGYVAKYLPSGTQAWVRQFSSPAEAVFLIDMVTDAAGNSYLAGFFYDSLRIGSYTLADPNAATANAGRSSGFVAALDAQGQVRWAFRVGMAGGGSLGNGFAQGLALGPDGRLAVAGYFAGSTELAGQPGPALPGSGKGFYVASLTGLAGAMPTVEWVRTTALRRSSQDVALGFDAAGALYAGLVFEGPATFGSYPLAANNTSLEPALVKYAPDGSVAWARLVPPTLPGGYLHDVLIRDLAVAPDGAAHLLLLESGVYTTPQRNLLLAHYTPQGAAGWRLPIARPTSTAALGALALAPTGDLYVAGSVADSLRVGGVLLTVPAATGPDLALFAISPQGHARWGQRLSSGPGGEYWSGLAIGPAHTVHLAGLAQGGAVLGPVALPSATALAEPLLGSFFLPTLAGTAAATAATFTLAPNPARAFATLTLPAAPVARAFALRDALGRPVRHYAVPAGATTARLDVAGLPAGLYVLHGAGASRKLVLE